MMDQLKGDSDALERKPLFGPPEGVPGFPVVTAWLVVAVIVAYWAITDIYAVALVPAHLWAGESPHGLLTHALQHADVNHLLSNAVALVVFGRFVERALGSLRFAAVFGVSVLGGGFAQAVVDASSHVPMIGASGGLSGLVASYLLVIALADHAGLREQAQNAKRYAVAASFAWVASQLPLIVLRLLHIAVIAHLGGFLVGGLTTMAIGRFVPRPPPSPFRPRWSPPPVGIALGRAMEKRPWLMITLIGAIFIVAIGLMLDLEANVNCRRALARGYDSFYCR
ncbi:MAG: rhomboid family intramembrane serine protease [Polyangiaceae bacterium]|nr:rhomboid family intramembrane serine protease [Polyangiaceae bacterium]